MIIKAALSTNRNYLKSTLGIKRRRKNLRAHVTSISKGLRVERHRDNYRAKYGHVKMFIQLLRRL